MRAVINNQICLASCVLAFFALFGSLEVSALQCEPQNEKPQTDEMGVSVCEGGAPLGQNLSGVTVDDFTYPSDGQFSHTKLFQIRSCGNYYCHRPAYFNLRSDGVTLEGDSGSKIPLEVSIKQQYNGKTVTFPAQTECNNDSCDFKGAGLYQQYQCEECLDFELTMKADLNDLIKKGVLTQSGTHSGTLTFTIDQAPSTEGINANDADVDWDVNLSVELNMPSLIQISGLEDMYLSSEGKGTQQFCVYTLGAPTFSLMPDSTNGESLGGAPWSDFRLSNKAKDYHLLYSMTIKDGTKSKDFYISSDSNPPSVDYTGWKPSIVPDCRTGDNMELKIFIYGNIDTAPAGVYSDTMEITVIPE